MHYHPHNTISDSLSNHSCSMSVARPYYWVEDTNPGYTYFGARYYEPDLSVWLSVDPLASKYPTMSPYMYCAGNPVMFIDPDGMRVVPLGDEAIEAYSLYIGYVDMMVDAYDNKTASLKALGTRRGNRRAKRRQRKRWRNDFVKIQSETNQLKASKDVFNIRMGENVSSKSAGGSFRYNAETKAYDINILKAGNFTVMQKLAHEMKHAYQLLIGDLDFDLYGMNKCVPGALFDRTDEIMALSRQNLFEGPKINDPATFADSNPTYKLANQTSKSIGDLSRSQLDDLKSSVELGHRIVSKRVLREVVNKK